MESSITPILADNLLAGRSIAVSGDRGLFREAIHQACKQLGADDLGSDALIFDGSGFSGGQEDLTATMESLWELTRQAANETFIPAGSGQLIAIAPSAEAGEYAPALRAAFENLARTLSTEWARYGIRTVALLPAKTSSPESVSTLVAYLCSPAGEYFSGCKLELTS